MSLLMRSLVTIVVKVPIVSHYMGSPELARAPSRSTISKIDFRAKQKD
jgi:hypothetical protein